MRTNRDSERQISLEPHKAGITNDILTQLAPAMSVLCDPLVEELPGAATPDPADCDRTTTHRIRTVKQQTGFSHENIL